MNTSNGAKAGSTATDPARGMALLRDPLLNKGTAFTEQERDTLGLRGLLPAHVLSMEAQAGRANTRHLNLRRAVIARYHLYLRHARPCAGHERL